MIWLTGQMWAALLLAFAIGVFTGWWARPPREPRRPSPLPEPPPVRVGPRQPSPSAPPPPDGPFDDLTRIRGIGPHYERLLRENGVGTYIQLAELTEAQVAWLDEKLGAGERIRREDWPGQAKALLRRL